MKPIETVDKTNFQTLSSESQLIDPSIKQYSGATGIIL
jgi:hypothetical protein